MKDTCGFYAPFQAETEPCMFEERDNLKATLSIDSLAKSPSKLDAIVEENIDATNATPQPIRNFDCNPTELYLDLMRKDWGSAARQIATDPDQCNIWIYRQEESGQLRWKLLPLHGAVIFRAPESLIISLLNVYPAAILSQDDQGMVPLHLAIRMGSSENIVRMLASPQSVGIADRKGRTSSDLVQKHDDPERTLYMSILNEYIVAVSSADNMDGCGGDVDGGEDAEPVPRRIVAPRTIGEWKEYYEGELEQAGNEARAEQIKLGARISILECELDKKYGVEKALEEAVHKLENHDKIVGEVETKYQSMCHEREDLAAAKLNMEESNKAVITNLVSQVGDLQTKLTTIQVENQDLTSSLDEAAETQKTSTQKFIRQISELQIGLESTTRQLETTTKNYDRCSALNECDEKTIKELTDENVELGDNLRQTERKLEEVTISEQELAWQNNTLQEKLASHGLALSGTDKPSVAAFTASPSSSSIDQNTISYNNDLIAKENEELKATVEKLSTKLYKVVGFLDEMVQEQEQIILNTYSNESGMDGVNTMTDDEKTTASQKDQLKSNVTGMKNQIITVIDSVIDGMPPTPAAAAYNEEKKNDDEDDVTNLA